MYEMLTGRMAFAADSGARVLAKILERDPDFGALPPETTPAIRRLIRRCLAKDLTRRLHDVADARLEIDDSLAGETAEPITVPRSGPSPRSLAAWVTGALAAGVLVTLAVTTMMRSAPAAPSPVRSIVSVLPALKDGSSRGLAISSDGRRVAFESAGLLHVRPFDQLDSQPVRGTEGGVWPAFSPDGQSLAFFVPSQSAIKRIAITGASAATITTTDGGDPRGLSWGADDTIVFATVSSGGLWRVRAVGGSAERLTSVVPAEALAHFWPSVLPNGRGVLFAAFRGASSRIGVVSMDTRQISYLVPSGNYPRYAASGHVVYEAQGGLWAIGFDADRLVATSNNAVPLVDNTLQQHVDVSRNGSLVYVSEGASGVRRRTLAWVDRSGREQPLALPALGYGTVRVSPDGQRIVADIREPRRDTELWVTDVSRPGWTRIATPDQDGGDWFPKWTPDGRRLVFAIFGPRAPGLFSTLADGTGKVEPLLTMPDNSFIDARAWTPDGKALLFTFGTPAVPRTGLLTIDPPDHGAQRYRSLIERAGGVLAGSVSPDGKWIVTESADPGAPGFFIERFPELGDRQRVSGESGGNNPVISADGREVFYRRGDDAAMMAVSIQTGPTLSIGVPKVLFESKGDTVIASRSWDVARDGRFLIVKEDPATASNTSRELVLVQNWFEELKRLAPAK